MELPVFCLFGNLVDSAVCVVVVLEETHNRESLDVVLVSKDLDVLADHLPYNLLCRVVVEIVVNQDGPDESFKNVTQKLDLVHLDGL